MQLETFVRKPFIVEAVEITEDNIEELAEFIGTFHRKENGEPYIEVDRKKVPNLFRVYPGFWMTVKGNKTRCYAKYVFEKEFRPHNDALEEHVAAINE